MGSQSSALKKILMKIESSMPEFGAHAEGTGIAIQRLGNLGEVGLMLRGLGIEDIGNRRTILLAGDHDVVEEGVSSLGARCSKDLIEYILEGQWPINIACRETGTELLVYDIALKDRLPHAHPMLKIDHHLSSGAANITRGPAMDRRDALMAIEAGIKIAEEMDKSGVRLLCVGEIGTGNTTPSSAILGTFSDLERPQYIGRGTGMSDRQYKLKATAIETAMAVNQPDKEDPIDVLSKLGGFEIAAMVGLYLGAASKGIVTVIDGFISGISAYLAYRLCPEAKRGMVASQISSEPGSELVLREMGLSPLLRMNLSVGQGVGATMCVPLIEIGLRTCIELKRSRADVAMKFKKAKHGK
jgi:nicotinate-nucleotide--dimethylbenzimidazole phosphoribosyltransferase